MVQQSKFKWEKKTCVVDIYGKKGIFYWKWNADKKLAKVK